MDNAAHQARISNQQTGILPHPRPKVITKDLRVAFAVLETYQSQLSATPSGDVVLVELPPVILGLGGHSTSTAATVQNGQNGQFFPLSRGLVEMTNSTDPNADYGPGPSYLEEFKTTAVHEFGRALGLQRRLDGGSEVAGRHPQYFARGPVDADVIASLRELYGTAR